MVADIDIRRTVRRGVIDESRLDSPGASRGRFRSLAGGLDVARPRAVSYH